MVAWRPQRFEQIGLARGFDAAVLRNAVATAQQILSVDAELPPIFTLRHLAHLTCTKYAFLRAVVSRQIDDPYTVFRIHKHGPLARQDDFRIICVPNPILMGVQTWIARRILARGRPHESSFAYAKDSQILRAAELHCGCRWLIKLDVRRFFESISELGVYRVFRQLGYQPLVAFELARVCTRLGTAKNGGDSNRWRVAGKYSGIPKYNDRHLRVGHLPQGAPSSPMLSNLAMISFDEEVSAIAKQRGLMYTRYADDLCLSTRDRDFTFSRAHAAGVIREVYAAMGHIGLSPNIAKTRIAPPGGRKVVLGIIVDGERPRLPHEFRDRLRQHLYYLRHPGIGPASHAQARGFTSVQGLRNHVIGLAAFAHQVEPAFGDACRKELAQVSWPV